MSNTRKAAGLKAKRSGDLFEKILETQFRPPNFNLIKIPMGAQVVKRHGIMSVIKKSAPFDFILQKIGNPQPVFFDAKSRKSNSLSYSSIWAHSSTARQARNLSRANHFGARAGFLVLFSEIDRIMFYEIEQVMSLKKNQSLKLSEGVNCGTLEKPRFDRLFND